MSFAAVNTFTCFLVPLTRHKKESAMAFASRFPDVYLKSQLRISHFTSPREVEPGLNRVRTRRKDFHYSFGALRAVKRCIGYSIIVTSGQHVIPSYFTIANLKKTQLDINFWIWKFWNLLFILYVILLFSRTSM